MMAFWWLRKNPLPSCLPFSFLDSAAFSLFHILNTLQSVCFVWSLRLMPFSCILKFSVVPAYILYIPNAHIQSFRSGYSEALSSIVFKVILFQYFNWEPSDRLKYQIGMDTDQFSLFKIRFRYSNWAPSDQLKYPVPRPAVEPNWTLLLLGGIGCHPSIHVSTGSDTSLPTSPLCHFWLICAHWGWPSGANQKCRPWSPSQARPKIQPKCSGGGCVCESPSSRPELAEPHSRLWLGFGS